MSREKLAENIMTFVPFLFKKLMKGIPIFEITKQQLELLHCIDKEDGKPMGYYSEKMMVPKPNITVTADKLIEDGLVQRGVDPGDRRVIILKITEKGKKSLEEHKRIFKQELLKKLDSFSDEELYRLNELFDEMKEIFSKLDHRDRREDGL